MNAGKLEFTNTQIQANTHIEIPKNKYINENTKSKQIYKLKYKKTNKKCI